ncbi:MAG: hypothetical protein COY81_04765 [Candidatus Pacebacteria bacterium CG_4_10_14_0_8_um_filter_43_12]|nr:MAG: hypothetical protein COY81_04765 [Candidatus Pacebacteria bacterium CG_4_10_14_0_8_um_filter_43_12]
MITSVANSSQRCLLIEKNWLQTPKTATSKNCLGRSWIGCDCHPKPYRLITVKLGMNSGKPVQAQTPRTAGQRIKSQPEP